MDGVVVRPMLRLDLPLVRETERIAQPFPWHQSLFAASLAQGHEGWIVTVERAPAGHGVLAVRRREATLLNLCVHPVFRGRGLGRRLLFHLLDRARVRGADSVSLSVRASNSPAQALYSAAGFQEVRRRRGGYPAAAEREDAIVLRLQF